MEDIKHMNKILEYREYFKEEILAEDPDKVYYLGRQYTWNASGFSTFSVYGDLVTGRDEWIAIKYEDGMYSGTIGSVKDAANEVDIMYGGGVLDDIVKVAFSRNKDRLKGGQPINNEQEMLSILQQEQKFLRSSSAKFTHSNVMDQLIAMGRVDKQYGDREFFECAGRLFRAGHRGNVYIFSIWNDDNVFKKYNNYISDYLKIIVGGDVNSILCQTINDDEGADFRKFSDIIGSKGGGGTTVGGGDEYKRREAEWKAKQHSIAGMLPKGWKI